MIRFPVALVACVLIPLAEPASAQAAALKDAGWIAGCWEARAGNRVTMEMWMPPAGNLMIGGSRTTAGGVVREFEHLRLRENDGAVIYTAIPSGQSKTDFTATIVSDTLLVFENLQHDFPQRIAYHRRGPDSIMARVEGMRADRTTRGFSIPLRRSSCILPLEP
jgi:hypothetical protein